MVWRGRSSTIGGMQRTVVSLLTLAVLAGLCSIASSFVASNSPATAVGRRHCPSDRIRSSSADGGSRGSSRSSANSRHRADTRSNTSSRRARGLVRRQRTSCLSAGGELGGEVPTAAAAAAAPAAGSSVAPNVDGAVEGGRGIGIEVASMGALPSLLASQSAAPARTEIPTDVAVVGAPQQVGLRTLNGDWQPVLLPFLCALLAGNRYSLQYDSDRNRDQLVFLAQGCGDDYQVLPYRECLYIGLSVSRRLNAIWNLELKQRQHTWYLFRG